MKRPPSSRLRSLVISLVVVFLTAVPTVAQDRADDLPAGLTPAMIEEGGRIFKGPGLCAGCHGPDGDGLTAPSLADDEWVHIDGSFEEIIQQIIEGVAVSDSRSGIPMLPRGGTPLTNEQVRAVAAYVWSLRSGGFKRSHMLQAGRHR